MTPAEISKVCNDTTQYAVIDFRLGKPILVGDSWSLHDQINLPVDPDNMRQITYEGVTFPLNPNWAGFDTFTQTNVCYWNVTPATCVNPED